MLEGSPFTIYTDHKPLTFALGKVSEPWTAMQSRQLSYMADFTTDIQHIPGSENIVADTLSRPPPAALLVAGQPGLRQDSGEPEDLPGDFEGGPLLFIAAVEMQGEKVVFDISTGQPRPIIPVADRRDVFRAIHELTHAGIRAKLRLMAARVVLRGMSSDVAAWCRNCQLCARGKASP
jgi:hypothetical protein